jgi:hypothetical protein
VAADQKAGEIKHCSTVCPYRTNRKHILCSLFLLGSSKICHYVCPGKSRGKVYNYCYVNETMSCTITGV